VEEKKGKRLDYRENKPGSGDLWAKLWGEKGKAASFLDRRGGRRLGEGAVHSDLKRACYTDVAKGERGVALSASLT